MARTKKTNLQLEQELESAKAESEKWMRLYNDLQRQLIEDVRQTDIYKDIIRQQEAERLLAQSANRNYVTAKGKIQQLQAELQRFYNERLPGFAVTSPDQAEVERLMATNERLRGENEALQEQVKSLISLLAKAGSGDQKREIENAKNSERITEHFLEIPNAPKRGPKPKADPETRQYIHELYKPLIPGTKNRHVNSLQAIGTITGLSKTQVFAIVKEPEIPGRWYSIENGEREYYDDYTAAVRSRKTIHFEADLAKQS